ncbi:hypothetical protein [Alkalihalobacillus sp. R86527]|uniref:hypothetical protein n=1 Tax=Alkalihalobacillus sp. R86527 TaxID=3093863 RepID=UPI00366C96C7
MIKPTDNVEVALNFDGYGDYGTKMSLYRKFVRNEPVQYGGFKIFYDKDEPVLTPPEVLQLDPNPAIINNCNDKSGMPFYYGHAAFSSEEPSLLESFCSTIVLVLSFLP